jgi:hypothetical protein
MARTPGCDENHALAGRGERRQFVARHDRKRQTQGADLVAHPRQQRARVVRIATHELLVLRRIRRGSKPPRAQRGRGCGDARLERREAFVRQPRDFFGPSRRAKRGLDGQLSCPGQIERVDRALRVSRELALRGMQRPPQMIVGYRRVGPSRQSGPLRPHRPDEPSPLPVRVDRRQRGQKLNLPRRLQQQPFDSDVRQRGSNHHSPSPDSVASKAPGSSAQLFSDDVQALLLARRPVDG